MSDSENLSYREKGIKALSCVLKKKENCQTFEKMIFRKLSKDYENFDKKLYEWCIYNIIGILFENENKKEVFNDVKNGIYGWKSKIYDNISAKIEEFDEYLINPFEVVEGVTECHKCGSKKTWNIQKQVRSGDEPMNTFSRCVNCGFQWTYSG